MRDSEPAIFSLAPIFRLAIQISVRRDDLTFEHHRIDVEVIILSNCKKPDIFGAVFPVRLRATSFLTFPGDPVLRSEIFFTDALDRSRTPPVATDVNGG